jgi:hypothetical protein
MTYGMLTLAPFCILAAASVSVPSGEEILARVANTTVRRHAISYSAVRQYKLRNIRFGLEATVRVQELYISGEPKRFTVLERSGSPKLIGIVEKLLASESEASRPEKRSELGIDVTNYQARLRGTGTVAGTVCYVIDLTAKRKNKYLINGTVWVDANNYGTVRLQGSPAARVSMWLASPQILEDFTDVEGNWLPSRTWSASTGMLLGTSELEILFSCYQLIDIGTVAQER